MPITRRGLLAAAFALLPLADGHAQNTVKVEGAWARATLPGQRAGGGYLKIDGGADADRLVGASAGVSQSVELHTMTMDGTTMRMRQVDGIEVPAGQRIELKPGGLHLMFIGLNQPLKTGERFPVTLRFAKAGEVKVEMEVMTQPAGGGGHGMHKP